MLSSARKNSRRVLRARPQGQVQDSGQQSNLPVTPLTFQRVQQPLVEATAFRIIKPPGLLALAK